MRLWLLCLCVGVSQVSVKAAPSDAAVQEASQVSGGTAPDLSCEGDGRYRRDCNWCRCVNNKSLCTKRGCPESLAERLEGQPECEGNVSFKRECNNCHCHEGRALCTAKFCGPFDSPSDISVDVTEETPDLSPDKPEPMCTPGSRWRIHCNWCTCSDIGVGMCTIKGCIGDEPDEPECEGTSEWKRDCNWCNCVRGRAVCTEKACLASNDAVPEARQVPGDTAPDLYCEGDGRYRRDCNWCRCVDNKSLCTKRGCPESLAERLEGQPECEGNVSFKRECNSCHCHEGRALCTTKFCGPFDSPSDISVDVAEEIPDTTPVPLQIDCAPGSAWTIGCNWCLCSEWGVALCHINGCIGDEPEPDMQECENYSEWMKDCNWCNCVRERAVCTEKVCLASEATKIPSDMSNAPELYCEGDGRYRRDCNWCRCVNNKSLCTKRGCPESLAERLEEQPECKGNVSFKRECNSCYCHEGRALCTTKFCGPFDSPSEISVNVTEETPDTTPAEPEPMCTDMSRWRIGCSWCRCFGTVGMCTIRACIEDELQPDEPECEGTSEWKRDCNWCNCVEGKAVCTEKSCLGEAPGTSVPQCEEGSSWIQDCNTCLCRNGLPMCTRRVCPDTLPSHCLLPPVAPDAPQCEALIHMWTYDSELGKCTSIVYGGCGGTENLFDSESDCVASCVSPVSRSVLLRGVVRSGERPAQVPTKDQRDCLLPMDPGPCFASQPRFFYNKASGKCENFNYGGCQGNKNRYTTLQECQEACSGVAPPTGDTCDRSQCPWKRWEHYIAKGCLPQYDEAACCPTRFFCGNYDESPGNKTQCIYKNQAYGIGERLEVDHDCSTSCYCSPSFSSGTPVVTCASIECPGFFRQPTPGCRPLYRVDQCCPYDYDCEASQNPTGLETRSQSCFWNKKTYYEGDKMYFDEFPCQQCICGPGFTDPFGLGCSKVDCGFEFRYADRYEQGCAPIFFEEGCCAIDWICPDDSRIAQEPAQPVVKDDDQRPDYCHLGSISMEVGKSLQLSNCEIDCRCITPPELTCVQWRDCNAVAETQAYKDCPEISCGIGCSPLTDTLTGCLTCSCKNESFTCPELQCPPSCGATVNYETGCPECSCECPVNAPGESPCPETCTVVSDPVTGCSKCECEPESIYRSGSLNCSENPTCTENCSVHSSNETDCLICKCDSSEARKYSKTRREAQFPHYPGPQRCPLGAACPQDCATLFRINPVTGCPECICNPNNPGNPFIRPPIPPPLRRCPIDDSAPPCPQDCGTIKTIDKNTGCQVCICDPNDTANPFIQPARPPPTRCPYDDSDPPCPADCRILRTVDESTGCKVCKCNPDNPGNPFVRPPHPSPNRCPYDDSNPPCPADCEVMQTVDESTGCNVCKCDPNEPGNPFVQPPIPSPNRCPYDDSDPPCPADCGIIRTVDESTGCRICKCNPDNPGNPFVPPPSRCPFDDSKPPCPADCGVIQTVDESTGCRVCKCDPNDTENPFVQPPRPPPTRCPFGSNPPCPQDCGVIRTIDRNTGCTVCICNPNDTFNPFGFQRPRPMFFPIRGK